MPSGALRPCNHPGCGELVRRGEGRCEEHKRALAKRHDQLRASSAQRGYGYRWQQYSADFLRRHPICEICRLKGRIERAECVDHIVPVTGPDDPLFWDPTNHQALSKACHSVKTATEDGGYGHRRLPARAARRRQRG